MFTRAMPGDGCSGAGKMPALHASIVSRAMDWLVAANLGTRRLDGAEVKFVLHGENLVACGSANATRCRDALLAVPNGSASYFFLIAFRMVPALRPPFSAIIAATLAAL